MAERQIQQIRNIYGEILGIADHLPPTTSAVTTSVVNLYNSAVDELNRVSDSNYDRFKITSADTSRYHANAYTADTVKPKLGATLARLEQEFGFHKPSRGESQPSTTIVTVNNNNQLSVTVVPIQEVLQTITDESLRADVEALKEVIQGDKDKPRLVVC